MSTAVVRNPWMVLVLAIALGGHVIFAASALGHQSRRRRFSLVRRATDCTRPGRNPGFSILRSRSLLLGRGRSVPVWKGTTGPAIFRNHFPNHWSLGGINGGNANRADLGHACRHWFHADDLDVSVAQTFRSHTFALRNLVRRRK